MYNVHMYISISISISISLSLYIYIYIYIPPPLVARALDGGGCLARRRSQKLGFLSDQLCSYPLTISLPKMAKKWSVGIASPEEVDRISLAATSIADRRVSCRRDASARPLRDRPLRLI